MLFFPSSSLQETYEAKRNEFMGELQKKEEEMRQMFVQRVKEKEAELKEAEKEVLPAETFHALLVFVFPSRSKMLYFRHHTAA